jgi:hypothetical protein
MVFAVLQVHKAVQVQQAGSSHSLVASGAIAAGQHLAVIPLKAAVPIYTGDLLVMLSSWEGFAVACLDALFCQSLVFPTTGQLMNL